MRTVIVYESMFGNTHEIADHVASGLRKTGDVEVTSVGAATSDVLAGVDLMVVGGPTHVHGLTSKATRAGAVEQAADDDDLQLDGHPDDLGLRDWLGDLPKRPHRRAAAFDTRIDASPAVTGRASRGIARRLRRHGCDLVVDPESFLVDKANHLLPGESSRAEQWGEMLAATVSSTVPSGDG